MIKKEPPDINVNVINKLMSKPFDIIEVMRIIRMAIKFIALKT